MSGKVLLRLVPNYRFQSLAKKKKRILTNQPTPTCHLSLLAYIAPLRPFWFHPASPRPLPLSPLPNSFLTATHVGSPGRMAAWNTFDRSHILCSPTCFARWWTWRSSGAFGTRRRSQHHPYGPWVGHEESCSARGRCEWKRPSSWRTGLRVSLCVRNRRVSEFFTYEPNTEWCCHWYFANGGRCVRR